LIQQLSKQTVAIFPGVSYNRIKHAVLSLPQERTLL
jgi:hypothetical protein